MENEVSKMENVNKSQNGQKRSRNPALWKENVAKERRNKGEEYTSRHTGKIIPKKEFVAPISCCPMKCFSKIDVSQQKQLHDNFWITGEYEAQNIMLSNIIRMKPKMIDKESEILRWECHFPRDGNSDYVTCQKFLCKVIGITRSRLRTVQVKIKNHETMSDKRGGFHKDIFMKITMTSNEIPTVKMEPITIFSDPLQIKTEWIAEGDEIFKDQQLNVRTMNIDIKLEKEIEKSLNSSSKQCLNTIHKNKTPSEKYMMNIVDFLKDDSNGKGILCSYMNNGKSLTAITRKLLVHAIIQREKDEILKDVPVGSVLNDWDISKERLIKLANEIEANFEGESANTYYIPFSCDQGQRIASSGKLLDHYSYLKRIMRNEGLLLPKYQKPSASSEPKSEIQLADITESEKNDLQFLQNHSEPFEEVKSIFLSSHNARRNILLSQGTSIFDYMCTVKALHSNEVGPILIDLDFNILHEGKNLKLFEKWPKIKNHLIRLLKQNKKACSEDGDNISTINTEPSDVQDILIFYSLHYLTATEKKKRKRKDSEDSLNALTSKEKRNPYLLHVEDAGELDNSLETLRESLNSKNEKFRSVIVIVGPLRRVETFYVVVNDIKYKTKSILHAIDLSLKIFHVFDFKYPESVRFLWQFFEKIIYDIQIPGEVLGMRNRVLKGEIQSILKNSVL